MVVEELLGAGHRVTGLASSVKAGAALAAAGAGVLPATVLRRAFGPALVAHLADPRFDQVIQQDAR